jgi:putative hydrolase of the HAD superfamily
MALMRRGIRLGVVSDAPAREAWLRLCHINYHHLFEVVVTYDDTGERKPSPKPFLAALAQLGIPPKEAIMVGDWAERDMVGAKNVGMLTAFAKYGDAFGNQNVSADFVLEDISDLLTVIDSINSSVSIPSFAALHSRLLRSTTISSPWRKTCSRRCETPMVLGSLRTKWDSPMQ